MKQLVIFNEYNASIVNVPVPEPGPEEVLIKVDSCGICGTDIHIYKGEYLGNYPVVPGHEFAGTVEAIGTEVDDIAIGDRVAVEPNIACGDCIPCQYGKKNFCKKWSALGVTLPGGLSEYALAPAENVFTIGRLAFEKAIFTEPLSCVLHGIKKLAIGLGYQAFIAGAGPIGNLISQVLKSYGVTTVVGEISEFRRTMVKEAGAFKTFDTKRGFDIVLNQFPRGFELVIDATGSPKVMEQLFRLAQPGGEILLFGVPPKDAFIKLQPFELFRNGLTFHASYTSVDNSEEAIEMLKSNRVDTSKLISHIVQLDDFDDVVALMNDPDENQTMKVVAKV